MVNIVVTSEHVYAAFYYLCCLGGVVLSYLVVREVCGVLARMWVAYNNASATGGPGSDDDDGEEEEDHKVKRR